jgi:hypothetical protein
MPHNYRLARATCRANIKGYAWQSRTKIASTSYAIAKFAKNLYALSLGTEGVTDKYLANIFHEGLASHATFSWPWKSYCEKGFMQI